MLVFLWPYYTYSATTSLASRQTKKSLKDSDIDQQGPIWIIGSPSYLAKLHVTEVQLRFVVWQ